MVQTARQLENIDASAEALLRQTLTECEQAADRLRDLLRLGEALVAVIPANRRVEYLQTLARLRSVAKAPRSDPVNENIVQFLKGKPRVTTAEVRDALTGKGLAVDQKQVANSLDYLTRRELLERIGRGEYRINPAAEAEIDRMITERYGPPTYRGLPPGMNREPDCY
jgi:hypothetical protein